MIHISDKTLAEIEAVSKQRVLEEELKADIRAAGADEDEVLYHLLTREPPTLMLTMRRKM
jgi:hypothetical protein